MPDRRGRPKGRKSLRVEKRQATLTMTPEAWAILTKRCEDFQTTKSDYVETLVRRGDLPTYDMSIDFLFELLVDIEKQIIAVDIHRADLEEKRQKIKAFMRKVGVSPNLIPKDDENE